MRINLKLLLLGRYPGAAAHLFHPFLTYTASLRILLVVDNVCPAAGPAGLAAQYRQMT